MIEIWKDIPGYDGKYQISNLGQVRNIHGRIMKQKPSKDGYIRLSLVRYKEKPKYKAEYVHILVANAFIPKPEGKLEVNHIDANKSNNKASNLEWVTRRENHFHAVAMGLKPVNPAMGVPYEECPRVKPVYQYDREGNFIKKWKSLREASSHFNCDPNSISRAMNGERQSCKGFIWKHTPPNQQ